MKNYSRNKKAQLTAEYLKALYPDAECALDYKNNPFKLLIMGRLSAQCTDKRVNIVSEKLFSEYPDAEAMSKAPISAIEEIIKPCGLYKTKAISLHDISYAIVHNFGGSVPDNMEDLLSMNGVGRKIANLVLGDSFGIDGVVCDTHCIRISNRLGLADSLIQEKVEKQLLEIIPEGTRSEFCHRIVDFGRNICSARNPKCDSCELKSICLYYKSTVKSKTK